MRKRVYFTTVGLQKNNGTFSVATPAKRQNAPDGRQNVNAPLRLYCCAADLSSCAARKSVVDGIKN